MNVHDRNTYLLKLILRVMLVAINRGHWLSRGYEPHDKLYDEIKAVVAP